MCSSTSQVECLICIKIHYSSPNRLWLYQLDFWLVKLKYAEKAKTTFRTRICQFSWSECLKLQRAVVLSVNLWHKTTNRRWMQIAKLLSLLWQKWIILWWFRMLYYNLMVDWPVIYVLNLMTVWLAQDLIVKNVAMILMVNKNYLWIFSVYLQWQCFLSLFLQWSYYRPMILLASFPF